MAKILNRATVKIVKSCGLIKLINIFDLTVCLQSIEIRAIIVAGNKVFHRQPRQSLFTSRMWFIFLAYSKHEYFVGNDEK